MSLLQQTRQYLHGHFKEKWKNNGELRAVMELLTKGLHSIYI